MIKEHDESCYKNIKIYEVRLFPKGPKIQKKYKIKPRQQIRITRNNVKYFYISI